MRASRQLPLLLPLALAACGSAPLATVLAPRPVATAVETTLWLIGDAGGARASGDPVLQALATELSPVSSHSVVVFLGDNIYPRGLPDSSSPALPEAVRRLDAQRDAGRQAGRVLFVPGNHDWAGRGSDGWDAIRRQGRYLAAGEGAELLPPDGCPGPSVVDVGTRLRLVLLDTQWWLHGGPRPGPGSSCSADTPPEVIDRLRAALADPGARHVVVVAHHPIVSTGPHGGRFDWKDHVFPLRHLVPWLWVPLPGIGSVYPAARMLGVSPQDMANGRNERMRAAFDSAFAGRPPLVYAAGHEHALEVHRGASARFVLVSGAGTYGRSSSVGRRRGTLFARAASGFMRLDLLTDGRVRLGVLTVDGTGRAEEVFAQWLE